MPTKHVPPRDAELTWDQRILARIESGIDVTQIEENLKLTPTERLERMESVVRELEEMREQSRSAAHSCKCTGTRSRAQAGSRSPHIAARCG